MRLNMRLSRHLNDLGHDLGGQKTNWIATLEQEGGEAENILNFEHFSKYNVQHFVSYKFLNIIHDYIH